MTATMTTMECPRGHGPMVRRVLGGTPEQRWAGTWWDCPAVPRCWSSVLVPSAELLTHLREQAPPTPIDEDWALCAEEAAWKRRDDH